MSAGRRESREAAVKKGRPYRGKQEDERKKERRDRLVSTGLELFATRGYTRTPIEYICEVSHVTTRHFYQLFKSKEELLRAVLEMVMEGSRSAVAEALMVETEDPVERARAGLSAFVHSYLDDPRRARIVLVETVGVSQEMEKYRRELMHEFAAVIEGEVNELMRKGLVAERDRGMGSLAMAGAVNVLLEDWVYADDPPPVEEVIEELVELFEVVIRGMEIVDSRKKRQKGARESRGR
ncbi:MAG: TetR/AcrR family transcriptional regulator [Actinobacteria bacterium]|nr:TetR/AcrR family transcriptional regulator [Actinomycetota bacterium]